MSIERLSHTTKEPTIKKVPLVTVREGLAGAALLATLGVGFAAGIEWANDQDESIRASLSENVEQQIAGATGLEEGDGHTSQSVFGEVKSADVILTDGSTCQIGYETYGGEDTLLGFDMKANLVTTGNCPVK